MQFLKGVDKDNIMLVNLIYHKGGKHTEYTDYLDVIYKDLNTGEKFVKTIENPEIEIYFTKEEHRNYDYNKSFLELSQAEMHTCKYREVPFYIAKQAGDSHIKRIKQLIEMKNYAAIQNIHKYPYVFGSDYDIENWYRIQWVLNYDNDKPKPITKSFLDIEADTINVEGFPRGGECPINAISIVDEESKSCYTFLLENDKNPQIQEFKDNIESFIEELHVAFDESYGEFKYNIFMYDNEKKLLIDTFKLINTLKRDFLMIWNAGFDIPYIIARLKELGLDPIEVMCHKDFKIKELYYKKDYNNFAIANKGDYFTISSYTVFLDQMIVYAGLRKGQSELRSHNLNAIAEIEIKDNKLDYSEEADIKTLPYVNYKKFVMYNIKDVLLQYGIERKTHDIDNIYQRAYTNATCYQKIFKQTVFLKNRAYLEYYKQGLIIGNNVNIEYGLTKEDKDKEKKNKFDGALVADPLLNCHTGIKVLGQQSMYIFDNVVDMDFSSMYPHIIIAFNIAPNCMIGKLIINKKLEEVINDTMTDLTTYVEVETDEGESEIKNEDEKYDAGKDFVDNMLIGNVANMGVKWFNLPDIHELDSMIRKEFGIDRTKKFMIHKEHYNNYYADGLKIII